MKICDNITSSWLDISWLDDIKQIIDRIFEFCFRKPQELSFRSEKFIGIHIPYDEIQIIIKLDFVVFYKFSVSAISRFSIYILFDFCFEFSFIIYFFFRYTAYMENLFGNGSVLFIDLIDADNRILLPIDACISFRMHSSVRKADASEHSSFDADVFCSFYFIQFRIDDFVVIVLFSDFSANIKC